MKAFTFLISCFFLGIVVSQATIIHVPDDQPTIQQAIDFAQNGDTILVSPGTYFENINYHGKNVFVASNYIFNNDLSFIHSTIIDGSQPLQPDTASCVLIVSGEDSTAVLTGFTLTGGTGTLWEDEHNLNHWYTEGGGILIQYSSPTIKNNIIRENLATNVPSGATSAGGGAIRSGDSNPYILNNLILNNQGRYGAGIVLNFSGAVIKNNIIAYNFGGQDYGGGGIWFYGNGPGPRIFENNTIVYNSSATGGGGIRAWSTSADISNCIIWGNTAAVAPQIQGGVNLTYSAIESVYSGNGNIYDNPLFEPDNLLLSDDSPCIDSGNPDMVYNDPEDGQNPGFAQFPAKGSLLNDMGAYGGPGCMALPDVITSIENTSSAQGGLVVIPNPVENGKITIKHSFKVSDNVIVNIYNLSGNLVFSGTLQNNVLILNEGFLQSGLYLLQLDYAEGSTSFTKFVVK
ncbi:MAG: T9SS type A sorting domain-containing protein [Bacteroidales bacterium]|nr:T9SS type A sorting domain-containing protein [Bacteroidales bacterium]MCF8403820.1 T9SS type A sorting domain-containing protein [Bacteroidales bacterium]